MADPTQTQDRRLRIVDPMSGDTVRVKWLHPSDPTNEDINGILEAYRSQKAQGGTPGGGYHMSEAEAGTADAAQAFNAQQAADIHNYDITKHPIERAVLHPLQTIGEKAGGLVGPKTEAAAGEVGSLLDQYSPIPALARATQTIRSVPQAPDVRTAVSRAGLGAAQAGLGALTGLAAPVAGTIGAGLKAASDISPSVGSVIGGVTNPFTTLIKPTTEIGRNAAEAADMGAQMLGYEAFRKGSYPRAGLDFVRQSIADRISGSALDLPTNLEPSVQKRIGRTTQQYDLLTSKGAPQKINSLVKDLVSTQKSLEADAIAAGAPGIDRNTALRSLIPLVDKWNNADTPREFVQVIANYAGKLIRQKSSTIPIDEAIAMKQNLQNQLSTVYERAMRINPSTRIEILKDAKSAIEQNVRKQIEDRIPGYKDVNNEIHNLLETLPYVKRRYNSISTADLTKIQLADLIYGGAGYEYFGNKVGTIAASIVGRMLRDPRVQGFIANKLSPATRPELGPFPTPVGTPPSPGAPGGPRYRPGPGGPTTQPGANGGGPGGTPGRGPAGGPAPVEGSIQDAEFRDIHPGENLLPEGQRALPAGAPPEPAANRVPPGVTGQEGLQPAPAQRKGRPTLMEMMQAGASDEEIKAEIARKRQEADNAFAAHPAAATIKPILEAAGARPEEIFTAVDGQQKVRFTDLKSMHTRSLPVEGLTVEKIKAEVQSASQGGKAPISQPPAAAEASLAAPASHELQAARQEYRDLARKYKQNERRQPKNGDQKAAFDREQILLKKRIDELRKFPGIE